MVVAGLAKATDLRRTADLCKRLADVPTTGGHRADQVLNALAEKLYRDAAQADQLNKH